MAEHWIESEVQGEVLGQDISDNDGEITLKVDYKAKMELHEAAMIDADGDMCIEHKKKHDQIVLYAKTHTLANKSGLQVWRGAFLLCDFVLQHAEAFANDIILELGCGIGFAMIVLSRIAKLVVGTDHDVDALTIAIKNLEMNKHGKYRLRRLDWTCSDLDESSAPFGWSHRDLNTLKQVRYVMASDVFFDDELTLIFLSKLHGLMTENPQLTALIATEKRAVFSSFSMSVIHLGYDIFLKHLCTHLTPPPLSEIFSSTPTTRYTCPQCSSTQFPRFIASSIKIEHIPQSFIYQRETMLELWYIHGLIN
ncbi:methyltransferase 22-like [Thraustotheca clavata]|uniref:Methyltransferase 22-like n=1 Tax=Thraustotheca clavata TaxID=74557 RepID=A0A1V9ZWP9_9STRA|nr:methyltransferase 22-like [Thraustotheca clavata]